MTRPTPAHDPSSAATSLSLLERARSNDQRAWERIVYIYGPLVERWIARSKTLQSSDAQDVFQEVFRSVAAKLSQFQKRSPTDTFRGWLRTITHNKVMDHLRRQRQEPQAAGGSDAQRGFAQHSAQAIIDEEEPSERQSRQLRALEGLRGEFEPRSWEAFWRVTATGATVKEVARDLGVTPSAVRLTRSRILRRLREELRDLEF